MMRLFVPLLLALLSIGQSLAAESSHYPTRPIRLIVPQSPGGTTDYTARLIGPRLGERLGQAVVVDNRPGAGSMLGIDLAAKATPDVPSMAEAGLAGYDELTWNGFVAPVRAPALVLQRLYSETAAVLKTPFVREKLTAEGAEPGGITPDAFSRIIRAEIVKWAKVIRDAGIKPE